MYSVVPRGARPHLGIAGHIRKLAGTGRLAAQQRSVRISRLPRVWVRGTSPRMTDTGGSGYHPTVRQMGEDGMPWGDPDNPVFRSQQFYLVVVPVFAPVPLVLTAIP